MEFIYFFFFRRNLSKEAFKILCSNFPKISQQIIDILFLAVLKIN